MRDAKPRGVKAPMSLLPLQALRAVASVFLYGNHKYGGPTWADGDDASTLEERQQEYLDAALRHLTAVCDPNTGNTDESGCHHVLHAIASLLIYVYISGIDFVTPNHMDKPRGWGSAFRNIDMTDTSSVSYTVPYHEHS